MFPSSHPPEPRRCADPARCTPLWRKGLKAFGAATWLWMVMMPGWSASVRGETTYDFTYSGRLTETSGKPYAGPVSLKVSFFHDATSQSPVLSISDGLRDVELKQGVFQIALAIAVSDYDKVFSDVGQAVWVQITDVTHGKTYPKQKLQMAPYASKVPVDGATVSFNGDGKLSVGPAGAAGSNQFLTKDSSGRLVWGTPSTGATSIQGQAVSSSAPSSGQVLTYNGTQWTPSTIVSSGGTVTSLSASTPLAVTSATTTPSLSIAQASGVSGGYLSAGDYLAFNAKQPALGFASVKKAGDTMTGSLAMGSQKITGLATPTASGDAATKGYVDSNALKVDGSNALTSAWAVGNDLTSVGNVGLSAQKTLLLGALTNAQETTLVGTLSVGASSPDKGKTWFNTSTNQIKYYDGSAAQVVGAAGSGLNNLNGATGNTQTFAAPGTSGTVPAWSTSSNTHTLNIPLAASASVTAGLLSNADYATFNSKQPAGNYLTALTGDVTASGPGSAATTLSTTGVTAGTYAKVTVDAKGRVTSATTLSPADIPALSASQITSGTLATSVGGTGVSSTATFPTAGVLVTEAGTETLTNKTLTSPVISSISNTGTLTLPTSTDTLIGRATTDTLTNKTLSAATINGASTIAGSTIINTSGSVSASAYTSTGNVTIQGNATNANKLVFNDKGTINALTFKAPDTLAGSVAWTLPGADGSTGQLLTTNGSGTLSWVSGSTPTGTAGGDLVGSFPNPTLATSGVTAGTYTKVTVDTKGRATAGTTLVAADIPTLPASIIGGVGAIGVPNGGTGATSFTSNGVLLGNAAGNLLTTAAGSAYQSLTVPSGGGVPSFSAVNLSQAAAVTGTLLTASGGTGVSSTATFPASGVVVTETGSETLTNKTLTAPIVSSIVNTGTLTLPTVTDTLVARTTTDTLTNKTLTAATINGASTIAGSTTISTTGTISSGANTVAGNVTIQGNATTANKLVFNDKGTTNALTFKAPDTLSGSVSWTLPGSDGSSGQLLTTNGTGTLSWVSGSAPTGSAGGDLVGSYPSPTLATSGVTAGTYPKVTVDAKGRVTAGATLAATDLPVLVASGASHAGGAVPDPGASAGTTKFLREDATWVVPSAAGTAGGDLTGSYPNPTLATSGVTAGTYTKVTVDAKGRATAGTTLVAADLPPHSAALITSGTLGVANGGTGLTAAPTNGQIPIGNGTNFSLSTLTAGNGINVTNAAGTVTVAATADASTKVSRSGDTMTGTLNLAANGLIAGTNQLVLSGGNVGIGTTSPIGLLNLSSPTGPTLTLSKTNATAKNWFIANNSAATNTFSIADESAYRLNIDPNGNVGIGTATPSYILQVNTSGAVAGAFYGTATDTWLNVVNSTAGGRSYALISSGTGSSAGVGNLNLYDATAGASRLSINSVGNVGIGTTSPGATLELANSSGTVPRVLLSGTGVGGATAGAGIGMVLGFNSTNNRQLWFTDSSQAVNNTNPVLRIGIANTYAYIDSNTTDGSTYKPLILAPASGNVGIGTNAPANTLQVAGGVTATEYTVSTGYSAIPAGGSFNASTAICRRAGSFLMMTGYATLSSATAGWPLSGLVLPAACRPSIDLAWFPIACWNGTTSYPCFAGIAASTGAITVYASSAIGTIALTSALPAD